jgi:hypothetical protein
MNLQQTEDPRITEARRLLWEVTEEQRELQKTKYAQNKCVCKHARLFHSVSYSINFTGGMCHKCKCRNFMMK